MDTKNQLTFFLLSVGIGLVGGLLYELFAVVRFLGRCNRGKRKILGFLVDIAFCLAFAIWAIFAMAYLRFPDLQGYMCIGWLLGWALSSRILHKILALCGKVCYNVLVKIVAKAKSKEKTLPKERDI